MINRLDRYRIALYGLIFLAAAGIRASEGFYAPVFNISPDEALSSGLTDEASDGASDGGTGLGLKLAPDSLFSGETDWNAGPALRLSSEEETAPETVSQASLSAGGVQFSQDVILRGGSLGFDSVRAFQIWGDLYKGSGKIHLQDSGYRTKQDFDGAMIGLTLGLGSAFSISGYYNYQDASTEFREALNKTRTQLGGLGLRYNLSGFYFSLLGSYGDDTSGLTSQREENTNTFDYKGWQANGFFETGFQWPTGGRMFVLTPFSNFQYSTVKFNGFDSDEIVGTGEKVKYNAFYQTLGSRVDMNLPIVSFLGLQGRLAWIHQYLSDDAPFNNYQIGRIPGTITPTTLYYDGNTGRDWFWCGLGANISLFDIISFTADYDLVINKYQTTHIGSIGLLVGF